MQDIDTKMTFEVKDFEKLIDSAGVMADSLNPLYNRFFDNKLEYRGLIFELGITEGLDKRIVSYNCENKPSALVEMADHYHIHTIVTPSGGTVDYYYKPFTFNGHGILITVVAPGQNGALIRQYIAPTDSYNPNPAFSPGRHFNDQLNAMYLLALKHYLGGIALNGKLTK